MIELRDYQSLTITKVIEALKKGHKKIMVVLPTGAGKTAISSELVRRSFLKGKSSVFICHREELLNQTYKTYVKNDIKPAIIKGGVHPDYSNPMQIASVNTLVRRLDLCKKPDILFVDECHHSKASQWSKIIDWAKDSVVIGLTATPCRLDGKPLRDMFDCMIDITSTKELINKGWLDRYLYYAPSDINTSELKTSNGDYTKKSLEEASFSSRVIGDNIEQYKKLANGKRNVVFAVSCNHGRNICQRYNDAGIKAEFVDGNTPRTERKDALKRFEDGKTKVLVNVDLFGEGFDLPAIEVVSLLRPTQSTSLYLQQVGRALRPCKEIGKTHAIILDHVNNYKRHGLPDDLRQWSLEEGEIKKKRETEGSTVALKRCPMCFFAHPPALRCPNCGYEYQSDGKTIEEVAGELTLIGSEDYKKLKAKEVIVASSLEELVIIEKKRKYKFGWAEKQWEMKTGEKLKGSLRGFEIIAKARGYSSSWAWVQAKRIRRV